MGSDCEDLPFLEFFPSPGLVVAVGGGMEPHEHLGLGSTMPRSHRQWDLPAYLISLMKIKGI